MGILEKITLGVLTGWLLSAGTNLAIAKGENLQQLSSGKEFIAEKGKSKQIFYFWATWCPDCKAKLKSDLSKYEKDPVQLVTIPTDKDFDKISDYLEKNEIRWSVLVDQEKYLQKLFKVYSVPTAVLAKFEAGQWKVEKMISGTNWEQIDEQLTVEKGM